MRLGPTGSLPLSQLLLHDAPDDDLQRLLLDSHLRAESIVDEGLVAAAAGCLDALSEEVQEVVVEPDGDTRLAGLDGDDRAATAATEIVVFAHVVTGCFRTADVREDLQV